MPRRIRLRRTKGWRLPEGAVVVARPTKWGNPYRPRPGVKAAAAVVVALYRHKVEGDPDLSAAARRELRGRDLACWCPLDQPCHADVLIEVANAAGPEERDGDGPGK